METKTIIFSLKAIILVSEEELGALVTLVGPSEV